jgi:hypothetical protein
MRKTTGAVLLVMGFVLFPAQMLLAAPSFLVEPYLQSPATDGMTVMWETGDGDNRLEYWKDGDPPLSVSASAVPGRVIYFVTLSGLDSNRVYNYRVVTSGGTGETYRFKTWPLEGDGMTSFKVLAISDSQGNWPERLQDICENGMIDKECTGGLAENCPDDIAGILVTGDLVSTGDEVNQWRDEFFGPCKALFHYVPLLPAIGNHDGPYVNYLEYFTLPENGDILRGEDYYSLDYLNMRLITLNTTIFWPAQHVWYNNMLEDARLAPEIDYVLTQFHHACKSEIWPSGQNLQSCDFVRKLEQFSADCDKPSAHLFGHTHAYSRGQSRDVKHLWVNVAPSAGDIDFWEEGGEPAIDYNEFQMTYHEYGFVVWHFTTGASPTMRVVRRTGGEDGIYYGYSDETILDDFSLEAANLPPETPAAVSPVDVEVNSGAVTLQASAFSDPDGDGHLSSHWQVTTIPGDYTAPVLDAWGNKTRSQNIFRNEDTQSGVDITAYTADLDPDTGYFWRVRYRDEHFEWSDWSAEASFTTGPAQAWGAASVMGAGNETASRGVNAFLLLLVPAGVLVWARRRRRSE